MDEKKYLTIDGRQIAIEGERNVLEVARKAGIEIPTFCYHSDLSVYGACRLCLVDIAGRGGVASCSTAPEPGMVVKTSTKQIRAMRKIAVELLLAAHDQSCTTCYKSTSCKLLDLANKLGVTKVRFKPGFERMPLDNSNPSLQRDNNKCILCGDCVRMCQEVQGIGVLDFAGRGSHSRVVPAFGKDLKNVECIYCGQCARICPTGAIIPKNEVSKAWELLDNPEYKTVATIAPAVRVGFGEAFGMPVGTDVTGKITAALKQLGFVAVFDTTFAADLTVVEEAEEFLRRVTAGGTLPQFTSCCPAWVKYAEQFYPELLPNLSSCRSPQAMFGAMAKEMLPKLFDVPREKVKIVSIMPCTAKKFEAQRPEFSRDGDRETEVVLTTQELIQMIKGAGIDFNAIEPEAMDLPLGFKTGAGVIFGVTGGVSEAALRYAYKKLTGKNLANVEFKEVRGDDGYRRAEITIGDNKVRVVVVHSLSNAHKICEEVKAGKADVDLIEVMACPGGCVGGAGQPVYVGMETRKQRAAGLYRVDRNMQLHSSEDNPYVKEAYQNILGTPNSHKAHELLHTHYQSRKRIQDEDVLVSGSDEAQEKLPVTICVGTSCFKRGSQQLLQELTDFLKENNLQDQVAIKATFCHERCDRGPTANVDGTIMEKCSFEALRAEVVKRLRSAVAK
ncbi:[FeFe] hydrogenase, group A [Oligosphaera ethanolica]|uniref:NADH-quinone oxidoreductase subunit G n=1 Tax=Oligosphaera ethanolica TaxID=760260 RepID=A0AAE3VDE7_9BACT|nr:[FeFe] hydrogenase, group A [Oligosphaera ethanolica]MDQ0288346.1 NADH-quinone oxidoreductase subunit G [Oligosphaera ethanolica]